MLGRLLVQVMLLVGGEVKVLDGGEIMLLDDGQVWYCMVSRYGIGWLGG